MAELLDGVDQTPDVSCAIVEQVCSGHFLCCCLFGWLVSGYEVEGMYARKGGEGCGCKNREWEWKECNGEKGKGIRKEGVEKGVLSILSFPRSFISFFFSSQNTKKPATSA